MCRAAKGVPVGARYRHFQYGLVTSGTSASPGAVKAIDDLALCRHPVPAALGVRVARPPRLFVADDETVQLDNCAVPGHTYRTG